MMTSKRQRNGDFEVNDITVKKWCVREFSDWEDTKMDTQERQRRVAEAKVILRQVKTREVNKKLGQSSGRDAAYMLRFIDKRVELATPHTTPEQVDAWCVKHLPGGALWKEGLAASDVCERHVDARTALALATRTKIASVQKRQKCDALTARVLAAPSLQATCTMRKNEAALKKERVDMAVADAEAKDRYDGAAVPTDKRMSKWCEDHYGLQWRGVDAETTRVRLDEAWKALGGMCEEELPFAYFEAASFGVMATKLMHGNDVTEVNVTDPIRPGLQGDSDEHIRDAAPCWLRRKVSNKILLAAPPQIGGHDSSMGGVLYQLTRVLRNLCFCSGMMNYACNWSSFFGEFSAYVRECIDLRMDGHKGTPREQKEQVIRLFQKFPGRSDRWPCWDEMVNLLVALVVSPLALQLAAIWHRCEFPTAGGCAQAITRGIYAAFGRPQQCDLMRRAYGAYKSRTTFAEPLAMPEAACYFIPDRTPMDIDFPTGKTHEGHPVSVVPIFSDIINFIGTLRDGAALRAKCSDGLATIVACLGRPEATLGALTGLFRDVGGGDVRCALQQGNDSLRTFVDFQSENGSRNDAFRAPLVACIEPRMRSDVIRFVLKRHEHASTHAEAATSAVRPPYIECVTTKPSVLADIRAEMQAVGQALAHMHEGRQNLLRRILHSRAVDGAIDELNGVGLPSAVLYGPRRRRAAGCVTHGTMDRLRILLWNVRDAHSAPISCPFLDDVENIRVNVQKEEEARDLVRATFAQFRTEMNIAPPPPPPPPHRRHP